MYLRQVVLPPLFQSETQKICRCKAQETDCQNYQKTLDTLLTIPNWALIVRFTGNRRASIATGVIIVADFRFYLPSTEIKAPINL